MKSCDVFFITFDEPRADASWEQIRALVPNARRVHGILGFDAAYKECARLSRSERFFTIDGDNELLPAFRELTVDFEKYPADAVLSWCARNSVNGLVYGNGGVKNWPRQQALTMVTHESANDEAGAVDFCFRLPYYRTGELLSIAAVNGSPYQAFRSGFREGVKMCMERGIRPDLSKGESRAAALAAHVAPWNMNRLRIWCSVGLDQENGAWAILGARLGCRLLCLTDWDHRLIRDYEWFSRFWKENIEPEFSAPAAMEEQLARLERELNQELGLGITTYSAKDSAFFKSVYVGPPLAVGPIFTS